LTAAITAVTHYGGIMDKSEYQKTIDYIFALIESGMIKTAISCQQKGAFPKGSESAGIPYAKL